MSLNLRRLALFVTLLSVLALAGCESWGRPKTPLAATSIQMTRRLPPVWANQPSVSQTLKVELDSGLALLTVEGGKDYPAQVAADQLATLRSAVAGRKWQIGKRQPPSKVKPDTITFYELKAFTGKTVVPQDAAWTEPSEKTLPDVMKVFEKTFDTVARTVHPLSDDVDLLK